MCALLCSCCFPPLLPRSSKNLIESIVVPSASIFALGPIGGTVAQSTKRLIKLDVSPVPATSDLIVLPSILSHALKKPLVFCLGLEVFCLGLEVVPRKQKRHFPKTTQKPTPTARRVDRRPRRGYDRLSYRKLLGAGPELGWVSRLGRRADVGVTSGRHAMGGPRWGEIGGSSGLSSDKNWTSCEAALARRQELFQAFWSELVLNFERPFLTSIEAVYIATGTYWNPVLM